jgi:hypothetical protein
VRDEKMLEKLAMHDIQDVAELFSPADKCVGPCLACPAYSKSGEGCQAQGGGSQNKKKKKKKKKVGDSNQLLAGLLPP